MQLTITTDYAIRIIMYLSKTRRVTSAGEIAGQIGIAKKSLLATANKLRSARLIAGHMGVSGGYSLMRRPEDISLLDIMEVTEGSIKINHCLEHGKINSCLDVYKRQREDNRARFALFPPAKRRPPPRGVFSGRGAGSSFARYTGSAGRSFPRCV